MVSSVACPTTLAMPKSATFTWPSGSSSRFAGLMSRWTMPWRCAESSPSAVWRTMRSASPRVSGGPSSRRCARSDAVDELEGQVEHALGLAGVEQRDHVGMDQPARGPRLAQQPALAILDLGGLPSATRTVLIASWRSICGSSAR